MMKKKYDAPMVQIMSMSENTHLMVGSPKPNENVQVNTPDGGTITVSTTDKGLDIPDYIDYSKKFDSWSGWEE